MLLSKLLLMISATSAFAKQPHAHYRDLPPLREQDALERKWVQQRYDLIPGILKKQCVPYRSAEFYSDKERC